MTETAAITAPARTNDAAIALNGVDVAFRLADGGVYRAVESATLKVADGEVFAIVGPTMETNSPSATLSVALSTAR